MAYTFDDRIISDFHKDARGFRPGVAWMHAWQTSTDEEKQGIWDSLIEELNDEMDRERQAEARAKLALTERLEQMYSSVLNLKFKLFSGSWKLKNLMILIFSMAQTISAITLALDTLQRRSFVYKKLSIKCLRRLHNGLHLV